jgi:hypothetical protein
MEQIAATFRDAGVPEDFHRGAAVIFRMMAATPFAAESRESLDRSRGLADAIRVFAEHLPPVEGEDRASDD